MPALTNARHEAFAHGLAKQQTADEAYANAGFAPNRGNASRLKANESILARVAELQGKAAERAIVTVEDIARQLDEDRAFALECNSASAAVAATMGKAKVLGLIIEKAENVNLNYDVTDEPASEDEWAGQHARPN
jgi:phage terminase small subunit